MSVFVVIIALVVLLCAWFIFRGNGTKPVDVVLEENYKQLLQNNVDYYKKLSYPNKAAFEKKLEQFIGDVNIEGVGTEITDLDRVLIASSAIIPIFSFAEWRYQNLTSVILYPDTFDNEYQFEGEGRNIMGMVGSGYMNGQMLLSRQALIKGFSANNGKENAAIHEFVHLLDKSDGATDGVPENLVAHQYVLPWLKMIHTEMHRIEQGKSDINPYALTNEAEFFAVASEYFFEKPEQLQDKHPEIYNQLSIIFKQDPAGGGNAVS